MDYGRVAKIGEVKGRCPPVGVGEYTYSDRACACRGQDGSGASERLIQVPASCEVTRILASTVAQRLEDAEKADGRSTSVVFHRSFETWGQRELT